MDRDIKNLTEHAERSEKNIEKYLVGECARRGWLCLKYTNPTQAGFPDRIIILPGGLVAWVELKSMGRKPRPIQLARHEQLRRLGQAVFVADSRAAVDALVGEIEEVLS